MALNFSLLLGGPGTGKTEYLVKLIEAELTSGRCRPERVALVTFTKAAAEEARQRMAMALHASPTSLPYFRTLHSLCFRLLGMRRGDVLEGPALRELEKLTGERDGRDMLSGDAGPWEIEQLARSTFKDPQELSTEFRVDPFRFRRALAARKQFKIDRGLIDFTDMLEMYVENGQPLDLDLAIVDEVQDLTPLQWRVVERAFANVPRVIVAGDDDQAIHAWAGATIKPLLDHKGSRHVLVDSHRLPRQIHKLGQDVVKRIGAGRIDKPTQPAPRDGTVEWHGSLNEIRFGPGTWLLLARARYQLAELADAARLAGVPFMVRDKSSINQDLLMAAKEYEAKREEGQPRWHDALKKFPIEDREYLLACRRAGETLVGRPRVSIDTVHSSKGRQADHVVLLTDLTVKISRRAADDPDAEHRVLYVGLTRARESLHLIQPRTFHSWGL